MTDALTQRPPEPIALICREGKGCGQYTFPTLELLRAWTDRKPYSQERLLVMPMYGRQFLAKKLMPAKDAHDFVKNLVEDARRDEEVSARLATILLQQAERKDGVCAYWFVSALSKLASASPTMRVSDVLDFARTAMPQAAADYAAYVADKS